jgi:MarR family
MCMADWGFLTNHARVLLHIAHDPGARLRDIAASLGITERRAHGIITDLAEAGYVITQKDGRRNRYQIQTHLPVPGPGAREPTVGEVVALFATRRRAGTGPPGPATVMPAAPARCKLPDLAGQQHPDTDGEEPRLGPGPR